MDRRGLAVIGSGVSTQFGSKLELPNSRVMGILALGVKRVLEGRCHMKQRASVFGTHECERRPAFPSTPYTRELWRIYRAYTFPKRVPKGGLGAIRQVFETGALLALKMIAVQIEHGETEEVLKEIKRMDRKLKVLEPISKLLEQDA